MTVAELFVKCLENEGVRYVFGLPGEETEDLLFALERSSIRFIPTRHEQGAAFMADVWGRLSGRAGVCLATLGPGATNLITGVADANLDKSPVVAITGQTTLSRLHKESHQKLDVVRLFRPITKWNTSIASPDVVCEVVRKAFKIAESEKPGATHVELPEDVAQLAADGQPLTTVRVRRPDPDQHALREAVALLKRAKKPLVLAGNGAVRKDSSDHLRELVGRCHMPIVHTFMGQGAVSDDSPESLHTIGLGFRDLVMDAVDAADVVVTVGYDVAEYAPSAWNPARSKAIIHIDFTPAEVDAYYQPAVEIVADVPASLRELNRLMAESACPVDAGWYVAVRDRIRTDIKRYDLSDGQPFTVPGVLNVLRAVMADEDLLISDVGSHKLWIARNFPTRCPNGCLISNGLASMGLALPGGIAAALHDPGRRIVAAMGDGGFLMNSQELETAKRLGAAFTVLIFNDNDYGLISWKQSMHRGRSTGTQLTNPDFIKYAESFGIPGRRPTTLAQLRRDLAEALASKTLSVIEIPIDQRVNAQVIDQLVGGAQTR
ncbi:MAG: acetolactate synthase large subunit [Candidatus Omnitrophica bacterium]|nr:acetolactate synthase large subunit [Candidatus Omnitrophota bacterium]